MLDVSFSARAEDVGKHVSDMNGLYQSVAATETLMPQTLTLRTIDELPNPQPACMPSQEHAHQQLALDDGAAIVHLLTCTHKPEANVLQRLLGEGSMLLAGYIR